VRRDVSPQNVVLPADGATSPVAARLIDFGLADATGRSTLGGDGLRAGPVAADAGVVGNAAFMSPEQARGLPVRAVSDLYQVGAVLYFALTGRVPFP
ncbi:protein kinase domain-containing protein, partial [Klebsiella pneumoniae]|uniref:protein kinase domain-containing protein n=1 Tax=Klebsiella pneumoniae TaxID=573 RepID=UPI003852AABB